MFQTPSRFFLKGWGCRGRRRWKWCGGAGAGVGAGQHGLLLKAVSGEGSFAVEEVQELRVRMAPFRYCVSPSLHLFLSFAVSMEESDGK